ncbi:CBS domain-containing protein [Streptomyces sp. NPDC006544]|uniref:CBS domain-containing protein n=1 Tax=Streptomyces sp. NPDC006544 TaxID=3154583 RepID=UPI0033A2EFDD
MLGSSFGQTLDLVAPGVAGSAATSPSSGRERSSPGRPAPARPARAGQSLEEAMPLLAASEGDGLPVLDEEQGRLLGWVFHRSALLALHPQT